MLYIPPPRAINAPPAENLPLTRNCLSFLPVVTLCSFPAGTTPARAHEGAYIGDATPMRTTGLSAKGSQQEEVTWALTPNVLTLLQSPQPRSGGGRSGMCLESGCCKLPGNAANGSADTQVVVGCSRW